MTESLFSADKNYAISRKEGGPIILALAFVIALGGVTAAAITLCGWNNIKNIDVNWSRSAVTIVCR